MRDLVALAAAVALATGCTPQASASCPGQLVAALAMSGVLDAADTGCATPPAAGWSVPASLSFDADFSWDGVSGQLAYCAGGTHAAVLYGTRSGDHLHAEATVQGAVLSVCASTCTPLMTVAVDGDLSPGAPAFTGTLTESFHDSTGGCSPCALPCTSTYALTGESR
ncbi:MAG TPA: hypothetical protein VMU15_12360 [Anaeromyxobacter sp.]|nr:hypothetical protein [Anaeromyxobacter sp.]